MIDCFTPSERKTATRYSLVFDDGRGNGLCFPCDVNGVLLEPVNDGARANYQYALAHPEQYARYNKVVKESWSYWKPAHGICHCGAKVELVNEYMGACQCHRCGQWYNQSGQEVLPPEEWEENY